jgi:PKD repeat protein
MRAIRIYAGLMFLVAMLAISGCTGGREIQNPSSGANSSAGNSFPPPSALHSASYTQEALSVWGSAYTDALPNNHMSRYHQYGYFLPTAVDGGHDLADMAYATYEFQLDGYDQEASLRFSWSVTNDFDEAWVGLSDWQRDRWEWRALPADGCLAFDPARNISDTGAMYAIILCAGMHSWELQLLRVGPELAPPSIWLDASPLQENIPLTVNFAALGTYDPDGGDIAKYEWDWDGDGVYDADTGVTPFASHVYTEVGTYPATLRVTDDEDATSVKTITIQAMSFSCDPDTLYAIPLATHAAVGEAVRVLVVTGQPAYPLQFMPAVTVSFEQNGAYVPDSFNFGSPGGTRSETDGYWALLSPAVSDDDYLDLPSRIPSLGSLPDEGLNYSTFSIEPMGPSGAPATIGNGAILFNFQVSFSQPGTYHLGFIQYIQSEDMTYYAGENGVSHHWTLDDSATIVVE